MAIVVRIMGGLGNQMFQYACGYSLAKRLNVELKIDLKNFKNDKLRVYELDKIFNISNNIITERQVDELEERHKKIKNLIGDFFYKKIFPYYKRPVIYEKSFEYDTMFTSFCNPSLIVGYWQSEKYFEKYADEIRNIFSFEKKIQSADKNNKEILKVIGSEDLSVSIHVRRSDYLSSNIHNVLDQNYYLEAQNIIEQKWNADPTFFVFSDDIDWVKNELKLPERTFFIDNNKGENSYWDMVLMSKCKINIIANSSFSWWAAWLNNSDDKTIIAPKNWFRENKLNAIDLIPERWLIV